MGDLGRVQGETRLNLISFFFFSLASSISPVDAYLINTPVGEANLKLGAGENPQGASPFTRSLEEDGEKEENLF